MADSITVEGDALIVKDKAGTIVYQTGAAPPEPGPDPTEPPKLAITTAGGNATTNTPMAIQGTIDLQNVACDILVDAGPTSFGTVKADAAGKWSKQITMTTTGMWTITAHAQNAVGKTDSNSVVFQVSTSGSVDPPPSGDGGSPPEPVTRMNPGASLSAIQSAMNACPVGGSVVLAAGSYPFNGTLRMGAGKTLWADGVCTVTGTPGAGSAGAIDGGGLADWTVGGKAPGQGFVLTSMINATGAQRWVVACVKFQNLPSNGYDGSCVRLGSARGGVVVCCDFVNCQGNNLGMYSHDSIIVDSCTFDGCRQPISYQFSTDGSNGNNIAVLNNAFAATTRACMEMGPDAQKKQKMSGLKVNNNWFDDMNPDQTACDQGASLPISLVATATVSAECFDNYVRRGDRPMAVNRPHPAIEFAGPGPISRNTIDSFAWEGFGYNVQYHYYQNKAFNAPWKFVTGTGGGAGTIEPSQILSSAPAKPPKPTRVSPAIYYPWSKAATTAAAEPTTYDAPEPMAPPHQTREAVKAHEEFNKGRKRYPFSGDPSDPEGASPRLRQLREQAEREHRHR